MPKTSKKKVYDASVTEADIISEALNIFGPNGEHWTVGTLQDNEGNFCMLGAMNEARRRLNGRPSINTKTKNLVKKHLPNVNSVFGRTIPGFNDSFHHRTSDYMLIPDKSKFPEVKKVMCNALQSALDAKEQHAKGKESK